MVAERLISPTGAIHFGLLIKSCDWHVTEILAGQIAAATKIANYQAVMPENGIDNTAGRPLIRQNEKSIR